MNAWNDQLTTLRAEDEEARENVPYLVRDLKAWVENLMTPWDGRWIGYCKLHQDAVFLSVWILRDPRDGSPWISTPLTSDGEVIRLTGTGPSLHYGIGARSLELPYINGTWRLSEELQTFWLHTITNCVQQHDWAVWPTGQNNRVHGAVRNVFRGIAEYAIVWLGLSVVWFGTLKLISIILGIPF